MTGWVCGPIGSSMPSLIDGLPARPTPTMRPSLMPMSAFTTPTTGSTTSAPATTDVELRRAGPALGRARSEGLGVAPDRLVVARLAVFLDADPEVGVAEADAVAGRRAVAGEPFLRGEPAHRARLAVVPDQAHGPRLARRPALGRAGRQVEVEARRRLAVEDEAPVHPLERVVRRDADHAARFAADLERCGVRGRRLGARPAGRRADRRRARPRSAPSGSIRTTSRVPSSIRTSSVTWSTRAGDARHDLRRVDGRHGRRPRPPRRWHRPEPPPASRRR